MNKLFKNKILIFLKVFWISFKVKNKNKKIEIVKLCKPRFLTIETERAV